MCSQLSSTSRWGEPVIASMTRSSVDNPTAASGRITGRDPELGCDGRNDGVRIGQRRELDERHRERTRPPR